LSDTQLGLITGVAFAVCCTFLSLPLARASDRGYPLVVFISCILVWSTMTAHLVAGKGREAQASSLGMIGSGLLGRRASKPQQLTRNFRRKGEIMDFDPVADVMTWISAYGLMGLFAIALLERFVPVVPSYGLLLAVGIAAVDGTWSVLTAFLATVTGSVLGCAACFHAVARLGETRSAHFVQGAGRFFGMTPDSIEHWIASFRRSDMVLAFALQLVPTVRLFAPAFAALLRGSTRRFLIASTAGIAVWNGLFIAIGYYASRSIEVENTTVLTLASLAGLLVAEAALFWIAKRVRMRCKPKAACYGA